MLALLILQVDSVRTVISEGVASVQSYSLSVARDKAIEDALRRAVEQTIGTMVSSETIVENYELIEDRILTRSKGYVRNYRIISEGQENGLYRVKIVAEVSLGKLSEDMEAIELLVLQKDKPRIVVLANDEHTANLLEQLFSDDGFPVVDREEFENKLKKIHKRMDIEGMDERTLAKLALDMGAEVLVKSVLKRKKTKVQTSFYKGERIDLTLRSKIIDASNAFLLSSVVHTKSYPALNPQILENFVKEAYEKLKSKLLEKWQKPENVVYIYLYNVSFQELGKIRDELQRNTRGLRKVIVRNFTDDTAILEVISSENAEQIAHTLKNGFPKAKITSLKKGEIHLKFSR